MTQGVVWCLQDSATLPNLVKVWCWGVRKGLGRDLFVSIVVFVRFRLTI